MALSHAFLQHAIIA